MRFEHEGMSLWYGTPDAPAPEGTIHVGPDVTITVGVHPADASNKVDLLYRINQGYIETVAAKWLRHDFSRQAQYFRVRLPVFRVGDTVEYTAVCSCAGRQVPSPEDAKLLASSFHVVATEIEPTLGATVNETLMFKADGAIGSSVGAVSPVRAVSQHVSPSSEPLHIPAPEVLRSDGTTEESVTRSPVTIPRTGFVRLNSAMLSKSVLDHLNSSIDSKTSIGEMLNTALKGKLSSTLASNGYTALADLVQNMDSVDIVTHKDVPLRTFVAKQVQNKAQNDVVLKKAFDDAISELSDKTTIGNLLGLDKSIKDHPLLQGEVQKIALGSLLGTSPILANLELQDKFINLYAEHEGPIQDFWSKLHKHSEFKESGTVGHIQFTLQLGHLTQNNLPFTNVLQDMHQQGTLHSIRDLTHLDASVWTNLINNLDHAISVPFSIAGATHEEKVANYVSSIIDSLHRAFPTAYLAQDVAKHPEIDLNLVKSVIAQNPSLNLRDPLPGKLKMIGLSVADQEKAMAFLEAVRQEVKIFPGLDHTTLLNTSSTSGFHNPMRQAISQFLANATDFDFRDTHIDTYLAQNATTAFTGIDSKHKDAIPTQLKRMQRVFQVAPQHETMHVLLSEGLDSAHSIASIPLSTFKAQFQDRLGGEAQAAMIHAKAQQIHAMTANVLVQIHQAMHDITPMVIGSNAEVKNFIKQIPNWTILFGSLGICDCEHCRSVYSPASYFVDILQFLKKIPAGGKNLQDILFERRPDLPLIKLNCENAEKPLPYIDLINEILETYVALDGNNIDGLMLVHNTATDITSNELSANPAYTRDDAYNKLKQDIYPFTLPYNRPLQVVRAYLEQLGSSRYELIKTFQVASSAKDEETGYEYLNISSEEYSILTGAADTPPRHLWNFYGYNSRTILLPVNSTGSDPGLGPIPIDPGFELWNKNLARVPEFLKRTGLTYLDLIALLKNRFINPNQFGDLNKALTLHVVDSTANQSPSDACNLDHTTIANLDDAVLKKIYRFIRLWRKLGWQMQDLDRTIMALGATDIDPPFLLKLSQIKQLQDALKLPPIQLLSLWANIDGEGSNSLYNKLFQSKAIRNPLDADFALIQNQGKWELAIAAKNPPDPNANISTHIPTILAALRINAADLAVLTTRVVTDDALNLTNLSTLYRYVVLAKALKLSIGDLLDLKLLTGINPFTDIKPVLAGSPVSAIEFVNEVRKIQQSGFSVTQLNYLYCHLDDPAKGIAPSQQNIDMLIKGILDGLKKIASDNVMTPDPSGDILRSKLAMVLDSTLVNLAMILINGSAVYSTSLATTITFPDAVKDKISYDKTNKMLRYTGNMTQAEETSLLSLSGDTHYQVAISDLFQQPRDLITKNMASFLDATDAVAHLLENTPFPQKAQPPKPPTTEEKINYVLVPLISYLRTSLSQSLIKQKLSDALKLDTAMIDLLLGSVLPPPTPLILKSRTNASQYAMADFLALLDSGLSVTYFANKNLDPTTGNSVTRIDSTIKFDWEASSPDPAITGNTFSARWTGKILAQSSEIYTFTIHTNNGVRLWVDYQLLIDDWKDQPATKRSAAITLKAGQLYDLRMEYYNDSAGAVAELWWSTPTTARAIIPQTQFYPGTAFSNAYSLFSLLHKIALVINTFNLTIQEVAYLSHPVHSGSFAHFDLNSFPLERSNHTDDNAATRFNQWNQLNDFIKLRNGFSGASLIDVFVAASASSNTTKLSAATLKTLLAVTGWDVGALDLLIIPAVFNLTDGDFSNSTIILPKLSTLQNCFSLSDRLGISVDHLLLWATKAPDPQQAQDVKNTVKAQFDDEQWLTVAKTLNDGLRESQKAALVAHIFQLITIQEKGIFDSNQLYEHLLIDVDMSACMLTSRIVLANSSVQLFMQRCLLNLEQEVPPAVIASIDAEQWNWMKRYRVWEAARKVFLYPENLLETELRDDKTPFFKDLETELLQNEITTDTAEDAFLHYLEKLDQVSRLEICGIYWENDYILHVFGRSFSTPHIYYYRKLINGTIWTPWEKVNVDIEGDHLLPVVYNRRLHIFWPIFVESIKKDTTSNKDQNTEKQLEIKLAWSEYKHGKWSQKHISKDSIHPAVLEKENHVFKALIINNASNPPKFLDQQVLQALKAKGISTSSTFFDDDVLIIADVQAEFSQTSPSYIDSSNRVHGDNQGAPTNKMVYYAFFVIAGCHGSIIPIDSIKYRQPEPSGEFLYADIVAVVPPEYSYPRFMTFEQSTDHAGLTLVTGDFGGVPDPYLELSQLKSIETDIPTLRKTPTLYNLLYPTQFHQFVLQAPFFYQDSQRTYFVSQHYRDSSEQIAKPDSVTFHQGALSLARCDDSSILLSSSPTTTAMNRTEGAIHFPMEIENATPLKETQAVKSLQLGSKVSQIIAHQPSQAKMERPPELELANRDENFDIVVSPVIPPSGLLFTTYFHPYVCDFIKKLNQKGIPGLLTLENQEQSDSQLYLPPGIAIMRPPIFKSVYDPTAHVDTPYPKEDVDFTYGDPYSVYNWEVFFYIPLLIATKLSKNQKFEEAQKWFHYIFNPIDSSPYPAPQRYWKVLPFRSTPFDRIQHLLALLDYNGTAPNTVKARKQVEKQVDIWRHDPFHPHAIARLRLITYQKNVVMKYIDNLIAWGDYLFRQDTMESINEATQLYILASQILGPRPESVPARGKVVDKTYHDLEDHLDYFSNTLVNLENQFPFSGGLSSPGSNGTGLVGDLGLATTFYFCIPQNEQLLDYWGTVADRLFKIRHCMNIEGVVLQLPLFAPPINPALLVQAAAMGIDLNSILNDLNAAVPHYRFTYMLQKALELCNDVKALGASLLAALEKKDAEALAILRANQETNLLKAIRQVKEKQFDAANTNVVSLQKTLDVTTDRRDFYVTRIKAGLIIYEGTQLGKLLAANNQQESVADHEIVGQLLNMSPNVSIGFPSGVSMSFGGSNLGAAAFAYSRHLGIEASKDTYQSNSSGIMAGLFRRAEEWGFQLGQANKEITQINKQIDAAKIRVDIAQAELDNHDKQIENAVAIEDFLHNKYTNQDLYDWMVGQISAVYFQCYQMAYDIAKQAERTFRFERGLTTSNFITFGYWDSLKKGLLSGEQLYLDLKRLEMAYIDQNKREYEITKHISLVLFDPMALIALKETGECQVSLPEALFDMDYPGHYMRRIKSVSLTIPCVTGPYTSINCTLTLLNSKIRINSANPESYSEQDDDPRFVTNFSAIESIATSTAQNDSGMFEVNFRDERYLPFEGAGVASTWHVQMPRDCNTFDFETISDVIIKLNFTAREGGKLLRDAAKSAREAMVADSQGNLLRMFSAKHEFSSEWYRFLHPNAAALSQNVPLDLKLPLDLSKDRFPFLFRGNNITITITKVELFMKVSDNFADAYTKGKALKAFTTPANETSSQESQLKSHKSDFGGLPHAVIDFSNKPEGLGTWMLEIKESDIPAFLQKPVQENGVTHNWLNPDAIEDIVVVCHYSVQK